MIVTCRRCGSRFSLKEELLVRDVTKVRCSECGHIFLIKRQRESIPPSQYDEGIDLKVYEKRVPERKGFALRYVWIGLLALMVFAILGSLYIYFLRPELIPERFSFLSPQKDKRYQDMGVWKLRFLELNGKFYRSENGRDRFVITGKVKNGYSEGRSEVQLYGILLDENGKTIMKKRVYAGNLLSEEEINNLPIEEIDRRLNENSHYIIEPAQSISFMVVFEDPPKNISEFAVEGISSVPIK